MPAGETLKALAANLGNLKETVALLSGIDEKRLKLYSQLLDKIVALSQNANIGSNPDSLNKLLEVLRVLATMPVENIREVHATVSDLEKLVRTMPADLVALAKEALSDKK
jgi:hypothetical protein